MVIHKLHFLTIHYILSQIKRNQQTKFLSREQNTSFEILFSMNGRREQTISTHPFIYEAKSGQTTS